MYSPIFSAARCAKVLKIVSWAAERLHMRHAAYRWSAQDYVSVDGIPYVGRLTSDQKTRFRRDGLPQVGHDQRHGGRDDNRRCGGRP